MATIVLEVYCTECMTPLKAEVTGNAIMVDNCEQCVNLRSMLEVNEALEAEKGPSVPEGLEDPVEEVAPVVDIEGKKQELLEEFKSRLKELEGGE